MNWKDRLLRRKQVPLTGWKNPLKQLISKTAQRDVIGSDLFADHHHAIAEYADKAEEANQASKSISRHVKLIYEIQDANHPYLTQAEGEIQFNDELLDESVLDAMKKFFALVATNYSITTSEIAKTMRQDN